MAQNHGTVIRGVIITASSLMSEVASDNPEYDRALVELVGSLVGADTANDVVRDTIHLILREMKS